MGNRPSDEDTNDHLSKKEINKILKKLPPRNRLTCRLNTHHTNETLPLDLCYISLFNERLRKNFLKNVNGENDFKNWKITENGGDGWLIDDPPDGSDALPEEVEEFNGHRSCFATSYEIASKEQCIDLTKDKSLSFVINKLKPSIYASEWVAARLDCGATYHMTLKIKSKGKEDVVKEMTHTVQQWRGSKWEKLEMIIDDYHDDVEQIIFTHSGRDMQFWKGHYGMKMAGAVVKLLLERPRLQKT